MDNIKSYVQQHKDRFINELIELLKIPSVSADPAYSQDVIDTADAVKASLEKAGCDFVEICDTPGYPIVYGEKTIDKTCLPYWFTAITTCNRQTRWICALTAVRACHKNHRNPSRRCHFCSRKL
jgi:hypothetical protein